MDCPDDIPMDDMAFDVVFHPDDGRSMVSVGTVMGNIEIHRHSPSDNALLTRFSAHKGAVRVLKHDESGRYLFSGSSSGALGVTDMESMSLVKRDARAHSSGVYSLGLFGPHAQMIASGDDDGVVRVWDTRARKSVMTMQPHESYVSHLSWMSEFVVATASGDGSVSQLDIRGKGGPSGDGLLVVSDEIEAELTCASWAKDGQRLVVGDDAGTVNLFIHDHFAQVATCEHPSHNGAGIQCMATLTDDVVLTGSEDGFVRVISVEPTYLTTVVAHHEDEQVERIAITTNKRLLASVGHDCVLKFSDIAFLTDPDAAEPKEEPTETEVFFQGFSNLGREENEGESDDDDEARERKKKFKSRDA